MADDITLDLKVNLDRATLQNALNGVEQDATRAGKKTGDNFEDGFKSGIGRLDLFVSQTFANLASSAIQSVTAAFRDGFRSQLNFQRGIAEINSILPSNARLTEQSTEAIRDFSAQFGTSSQRQAQSFYNIVSAGVQGTAKQLDTLAIANKTAVAGLVDIDTAAFALVSSVNAYAQSGLTATQASDQLFAAVREGQTTFGELASTIGRVAPLAASVGIEFSDLTGTLATITKNGVSTAEAVTQVRAILTSLIKPTAEASKTANELGINFSVSALRAQGLSKFLEGVISAADGNQTVLSRLFGSIEAVNGVLGISNQGFDEFNRVLGATSESAGNTDAAYAALASTLDFKLNKAIANITASFERFIKFIGPALNDLLDDFNSFFATGQEAKVNRLTNAVARQEETVNRLKATLEGSQEGGLFQAIFGADPEDAQQRLDAATARLSQLREELRLAQEQTTREPATGNDQASDTDGGGDGIEPAVTENKLQTLGDLFDQYFSDVGKGFEELGKKSQLTGATIAKGLGQGAGAGFAAFGAAVATGQNALDAFSKAFLSALGNIAIQQGTQFILQGIGYQFIPGLQGQGAALISAGAALTAFGGAIGAIASGGGGAAPGTPGGIGGQSSVTPGTPEDALLQDEEITEERTADQNVQVVVQGDVLDSDESSLRISQLLQEAFDKQGVTIRRGFA